MKAERFKRTKSVVASSAIALVVAAVTFGATTLVVGSKHLPPNALVVNSGSDTFMIGGSVSGLAPGNTSSRLTLTLTNQGDAQLTVNSITAEITGATYVSNGMTVPTATWQTCAGYFNPSFTAGSLSPYSTTWGGAAFSSQSLDLSVGPKTNTTASTPPNPASMIESFTFVDQHMVPQSSCADVKFAMTYTGQATYTETYATSAAVTSSQHPSVIGQAVTYTATVTATQGSGQDPVPSTPTGTVTFKDGSTTICTVTPLTVGTVSSNGSTATATATCSPPAYIANGTHPITAVFTSSDTTEFANSPISPVFNQVVNATPPAQCTGTYSTSIVGTPSNTTISAGNTNTAIFAFGANYTVTAGEGNDCLDAGDGNNSLTAGNGTDNVVAGNGIDTVNLGNGPDTVTIGSGSHSTIKLGNGADTVRINGGSNDTITVGNGANTVYLGSGTNNTFTGGKGKNTCHVPSSVASLHDTVTNCTVVTP